MTMTMRERALEFCIEAHGDQKRKYLGTPYWLHCLEVAELVDSVFIRNRSGRTRDDIYVAALLHDTVEDTEVTFDVITSLFNKKVSDLVYQVTDVSINFPEHNRPARKYMDQRHLEKADYCGQTIKFADIVSNLQSICLLDPEFASKYIQEKKFLLEVLNDGSVDLKYMCNRIIVNYDRLRGLKQGEKEVETETILSSMSSTELKSLREEIDRRIKAYPSSEVASAKKKPSDWQSKMKKRN